MFGLFSSSSDCLYGSTATVEISGNKATKIYYDHVSQTRRRIEIENLEELGCSLKGLVRVPDLLSVKYDRGGDIVSITTQFVKGETLSELRSRGLYDLAVEAYEQASTQVRQVLPVVDLETDGNIRVEIKNNKITRIWVVDVGDIF